VSAQNAKDAADEIVARLRMEPGPKGRKFQLVTFETDEGCRFFYPRRSLDWQRQVNTFVSRDLRTRYNIRVQRISISPADYDVWLNGRADQPDLRRQFADGHQHLLP
jgi:hypothetical protein